MGSPIRLAASASAALTMMIAVSVAGCDGSPATDIKEAASAPGDSDEPTFSVDYGPMSGTCWDVPAEDPTDPTYWFDDSPRVPCGEPHTTETVRVLRLDEPTAAAARQEGDLCWEYVRQYVGIDPETWVPWSFAMFLPSKEQIAAGASWARCDAIFPSRWDHTRTRSTTGSAVSIADEPPVTLWACLDQHPNRRDQPFVPCDRPHAYEQTGRLALLDDLKTYPTSARLRDAGRTQCMAGVPNKYQGSVQVVAVWDTPEAFQQNEYVVGACFMSSADGEPLPPHS